MQLQIGIYIIITIQIIQFAAIGTLLTSNQRTREDLKIIRRRVAEINSYVSVISAKQDNQGDKK